MYNQRRERITRRYSLRLITSHVVLEGCSLYVVRMACDMCVEAVSFASGPVVTNFYLRGRRLCYHSTLIASDSKVDQLRFSLNVKHRMFQELVMETATVNDIVRHP